MLEGVGLRHLFGKLRGLLRCRIPREWSPPTGATSHQLWRLEGQWGKVEGIGTGARKGCKSEFDQKEREGETERPEAWVPIPAQPRAGWL